MGNDVKPPFRFAEDYRVVLQESFTWTNQVEPDVPDNHGFFARPRARRRQSARVKAAVLTLNFWCLNPAVVRGLAEEPFISLPSIYM